MIINKVVEAQVRYVPAGLLTGGRQLVLRWCLVNLELFLLELQTIHRFSQSQTGTLLVPSPGESVY